MKYMNEVVNDKDFLKSETVVETSKSIEDEKYPQEYNPDQPIAIF